MPKCTKCGNWKVDTEFYKRSNGKIRVECKTCRLELFKQRADTIIHSHGYNQRFIDKLWTVWRVTIEEYLELLIRQENKCACCKKALSVNPREIQIDHWPGTDKCKETIRGVLCDKCNVGLGSFEDSIERLECAIQYLKAASNALKHTHPERMDL